MRTNTNWEKMFGIHNLLIKLKNINARPFSLFHTKAGQPNLHILMMDHTFRNQT